MNNKTTIVRGVVVLAIFTGAFIMWKLQQLSNATTSSTITSGPVVIDKTTVDSVLLTRLQTDLQHSTPHFVDSRDYNGQSLTPQEEKIKNDIIDISTAKVVANGYGDDYSQSWPIVIGKRYIVITVPTHLLRYPD